AGRADVEGEKPTAQGVSGADVPVSPSGETPTGDPADVILAKLLGEQSLLRRRSRPHTRIEILVLAVELPEDPGSQEGEVEPVLIARRPPDRRLQVVARIPELQHPHPTDALPRQLRTS